MGPESARGRRLLPHTADVIVDAWGDDDLACAEEAAQALIDICVRGEPDLEVGSWVSTFGAATRELVRTVVEEVVFVLDTSELVPVSAHLEQPGGSDITLHLDLARRESVQFTGAAPKAIVMMDAEPTGTDAIVRCRFIVDV